MAERSKAAVLKTVVPQGTGGSNPSLSDKNNNNNDNKPFNTCNTAFITVEKGREERL